MRTIRAAVLVAAVGLCLHAVGCGPMPSTGKLDTSGVGKATEKGTNAVAKATEKAGAVGDLAGKVKDVTTEINKELAPLAEAFDKFKDKVKEEGKATGGDAVKMTKVFELESKRDEIQNLMNKITEKVGELAKLKDVKGLDDAKKAIMDLIEKVKPLLKDFIKK